MNFASTMCLDKQTPESVFKNSEIGSLPSDWDAVPVSSVTDLQVGFAFKSSWYRNHGEEALLRGENVGYGSADWNDRRYLSEDQQGKFSEYRLDAGDLVVGMDRTFTKNGVKISRIRESDCPCLLVQRVGRFKPKSILPRYLWCVLNSAQFLSALQNEQKGMDIPHLSRSEILTPFIPVPPTLTEQEAIASALGDADALIESLEQLLAKKRLIKQGAMQELLTGKRRLPGFEGDWKPTHLGECLRESPGYGINAPGVANDGRLPTYLRITDITDDGFLSDEDRVAVSHSNSAEYVLSAGDIVFARTGASVGKSYLYRERDGILVFAGFLIRARIDQSKLCPEFLFQFTHTEKYDDWVRIMSMRTGQPGINGTEYGELPLMLPPTLAEQVAISDLLLDLDSDIHDIYLSLRKIRELKKSMMQQLLTGRIRLA